MTIWECVLVHLRLNIGFLHAFSLVERVDLNLVVEVADVGDDRLIFHSLHVIERDHIDVAARTDVNVAAAKRFFDSRHFIAFHCRLQRIDRIDLGDDDARALTAQRLRAAFTNVAITANDGDLSRKHHIERAIQSVDQRMPAAVEVIELRFGDGIVHVDCRNEQPVLLMHLVESMDTGCGFFRDTAPILYDLVPAIGILLMNLKEQILDDLFFSICRFRLGPIAAFFKLIALVNQQRGVAAIVDHQLWTFTFRVRNSAIGASPVVFQRFTFPGENRDAAFSDRCCGMILR